MERTGYVPWISHQESHSDSGRDHSEANEALLALALPDMSVRRTRWLDVRKDMIIDQMPTFCIISDRLHTFMDSVKHRLSQAETKEARFSTATRAKIERSLIGFLEAQAFTRAFIRIDAGKESDVGEMYDWWQALWDTVPFENLRLIQNSKTPFWSTLRQFTTPSEILLEFLMIDRDGRYQDSCAAWLVTLWIEQAVPKWSPLLTASLDKSSGDGYKFGLKSEVLLKRLTDLGLPSFDVITRLKPRKYS